MPMLVTLILASTPVFEPVRHHTWGEPIEIAHAIESGHADSLAANPVHINAGTLNDSRALFLHYTFNTPTPFEFVALDFERAQLARIHYPLHLPSSETSIEKPDTDVPEKFQAVRAWLMEHLGEPDVFTSSLEGQAPDFTNVESLLDIDAYTFNYTWCSRAANAYLIAIRETGKSPIVVASLTPPHMPPATGDEPKHVCGTTMETPVQE